MTAVRAKLSFAIVILAMAIGVYLLLGEALFDQRIEFRLASAAAGPMEHPIFLEIVPLTLARRVIHEGHDPQQVMACQRLEHLDHMGRADLAAEMEMVIRLECAGCHRVAECFD